MASSLPIALFVFCVVFFQRSAANEVKNDVLHKAQNDRRLDEQLDSLVRKMINVWDNEVQASGARKIRTQLLDDDESEGFACELCAVGYYHRFNASDPLDPCLPCGNGACSGGGLKCTPCPIGTEAPTRGTTTCIPCTNYTHAEQGSAVCKPCHLGEQPDINNETCVTCQYGFYNNHSEFGHCVECPEGSETVNPHNCSQCPVGSYNPFGHSPCIPCSEGYYLNSIGSSNPQDCKECDPGYYCPLPATGTPVQCPANSYCKSGSKTPTKCGFLGKSQPISSSCDYDATFYILMTFIVLVCVGILFAGVIGFLHFKKKQIREPSMVSSEERMIPQSLPGPVYGGY